jgi:hypothetical protein
MVSASLIRGPRIETGPGVSADGMMTVLINLGNGQIDRIAFAFAVVADGE